MRQGLVGAGVGGFRQMLLLLQQDVLQLAPERGFVLVQAGLRGLRVLSGQCGDFIQALFALLRQGGDLLQHRGQFGVVAAEFARLLESGAEVLARLGQIVISLGIGRVENDVANGLAGLQALGIHVAEGFEQHLILFEIVVQTLLGVVESADRDRQCRDEHDQHQGAGAHQAGAYRKLFHVLLPLPCSGARRRRGRRPGIGGDHPVAAVTPQAPGNAGAPAPVTPPIWAVCVSCAISSTDSTLCTLRMMTKRSFTLPMP